MASVQTKAARPLSPHLQIYRRSLSMMMSIFHRITGVINYFSLAIVAVWLGAAASGPQVLDTVNGLLATWPGQVILLGMTWSLFHHMFGGIRHFIWDTGRGFGLSSIEWLTRLSLLAALALTAALWVYIYQLPGKI
jgi:succinate dehydrogenase / fumarate reductase, cytochrome b subunit